MARGIARSALVAAVILVLLIVAVGCGDDSNTAENGAGSTGSIEITSLDVTDGPRCGNQNVTITGTGFQGITKVTFGSVEVLGFAAPDATHLVVKTPAGELGQVVDVAVSTETETAVMKDAYAYWDYDLKVSKGSTTKTYTLDDIKAMPASTGFFGAVNDKPYDTDQYRGALLSTVIEAVGGWTTGEDIVVIAADGFKATFTTEMMEQMANGTYDMWNVNGAPVVSDDRVAQLLLAYDIDTTGDNQDWQALPAGKGPFKLVAATTQNDRMSTGWFSPSMVITIEVQPGAAATGTTATTATTSGGATGGSTAGLTLEPADGPRSGYQAVTIHGTGLQDATKVMFGSVEATRFTPVDDTRVVAIAPAGELGQKVDVSVTTSSGTLTLPGAYTYWDYDFKISKGDQTKTYTIDELRAMPAVTGFWGPHKDPMPYNTDQYRGVPLLTLLEDVGGRTAEEQVTVTSADAFEAVYTPAIFEQMADGTYPMWTQNNTEIITEDRFAQLIVAYDIDEAGDGSSWKALPEGTGPLRIVMIMKEPDRVNQGKFNPFLAMKAEVTAAY
jgi:hypothetical protein